MWPLTWPRNVKKSQQSFESSQTVMIATYCNTTLSDTTHEHLIILLGHDVKHVEKCCSAKLAQMRLAKASFSPVAGVQDMKQTRGVFLRWTRAGIEAREQQPYEDFPLKVQHPTMMQANVESFGRPVVMWSFNLFSFGAEKKQPAVLLHSSYYPNPATWVDLSNTSARWKNVIKSHLKSKSWNIFTDWLIQMQISSLHHLHKVKTAEKNQIMNFKSHKNHWM